MSMRVCLFALSLCCVLGFVHCGPGESVIDVQVVGVTDDIDQMVLVPTLDGRALSMLIDPIRQHYEHFELRLQSTDLGMLNLMVEAKDSAGCDVSIGTNDIMLTAPGNYDLTLTLTAQPGCLLVLRKTGDGAGQVQLSDGTLWSFARASTSDTTCPVQNTTYDIQQKSFPLGSQVSLTGSVPTESERDSYFAGWAGACQGGAACTIDIAAQPSVVDVGFQPTVVCSPARVCWENPRPQGTSLLRVLGRTANDVWAVGQSGTVLHWNGSYWSSPGRVAISTAVGGLWIKDGTGIVTVGDSGTVLRLDNDIWQCPTQEATTNLRDVYGATADNLWAVGEQGTLLHYDGTSWQSVAVPSGSANLNTVRGNSASDIFAVGDSGTILHYDGTSWSQIAYPTTDGLTGVWPSGPQEAWVVGENGTNAHISGGVASLIATAIPVTLYDIWGSSNTNIWSVGEHGTLIHYDGTQWSVVDSSTTLNLRSMWGSGVSDIWAVGDDGTIIHYNGTLWLPISATRGNRSINALWGPSIQLAVGDTIYAVGDGGLGLLWSGADWVIAPGIDGATMRDLYAIWGASGADLWMVGQAGQAQHWNGTQVMQSGSGTGVDLHGLWGSATNNVLAVGASGRITHYDGSKWTSTILAAAGGVTLRAIWGSAANAIWIAGDGGTILSAN